MEVWNPRSSIAIKVDGGKVFSAMESRAFANQSKAILNASNPRARLQLGT
ncbi:hypothetical protein V8Z80_10980 [Orrella sp. JC864]